MSIKPPRIASILVLVLAIPGLFIWWMTRPAPRTNAPVADVQRSVDSSDIPRVPETTVPSESLLARKSELLGMNPSEAREWILRELAGGKDYSTGSDLAIGTDQNLSAWPSYRVYLLDLLHLIDPVAAASRSRELVESSESPDEWAVALRNVARADEAGSSKEWLREKSAELLRNRTWRSVPSTGYLNAFDVIVHTEHTDLAPELLDLCNDPGQKAVRHASFLVIDRLTQARPEVLLPALANSANRYSNSGPMISNLMARADLRDEAQLEAVERYLLDKRRTVGELTAFAEVFPNANFHVSNNLLTTVDGIDGMELAERDRAALGIVRSWMTDARFSGLLDHLDRIQARIAGFVER